MIVGKGDPDDDEVMKEKERAILEEQMKKTKQVEDNIKFENPIRIHWFRDFALEKRISHIVYCIEHAEWPVNKTYSAYTGCHGINLDVPLHETVKHMPPTIDLIGRRSSTPDVSVISSELNNSKKISTTPMLPLPSTTAQSSKHQILITNSGGKKRKRHIAIDVETERAKLHALLNSSPLPPMSASGQSSGASKQNSWKNDDDQKDIKQQAMQPPPAHQHQSLSRSNPVNQQQATNYSKKATIIPGTSSTLTPIDLSSRYIKTFFFFSNTCLQYFILETAWRNLLKI